MAETEPDIPPEAARMGADFMPSSRLATEPPVPPVPEVSTEPPVPPPPEVATQATEPEPEQPIAYPDLNGIPHIEAEVLDGWMPALLTYAMEDYQREAMLALQARITDYLTTNP